MIKCILSGKLLKQFFIISLISCFILLGNSFVNGEWIFRNVNEEFMSPGSSTYSQKILSSSAGILQGAGTIKALIYGRYNTYNSTRNYGTFWRGIDNKFYGYVPCNKNSSLRFCYRKYTKFGVFQGTGFDSLTGGNINVGFSSDNTFDVDTFYQNNSFKNKVSRFSYYLDSDYSDYSFCWVFDDLDTSICVFQINTFFDELGVSGGSSDNYSPPISGLSYIPADFDNSLIGTSPWTTNVPSPSTGNNQISIGGGLDGFDYTKIDTGDLVYYFENNPYYRYDKGVCYIGTYDYDTLYSSGSTLGLFRANSGGTIFDLFSDKFGNNFSLDNVGAFINARNINYFTWFKGGNRDENNRPLFNAYYSLGSGFYQDFSDDIIVPFIGNPIAYYFMGYVSSLYGEYSTQGQSIATYCYYKLGLDKNSGGLYIVDDTSKDYLNNASDYINQRNKFYGLYSGGINIQSQSWNGSILDYFTGGQDNYDFNSFFSSSFNKFKNVISLNPSDLGAGVLPTYIILFLMAIILFRFLSH